MKESFDEQKQDQANYMRVIEPPYNPLAARQQLNIPWDQKREHSPNLKPTNPKDRIATARLDLTLVPDTATAYCALGMTEGDYKYGGYNYRPAGVSANVYVAACRRHLAKWYNGEDHDPKTMVPHLASAIACIAILIDSLETGNMKDDRPPRANVGGLLDKMEEKVRHLQGMFPNAAKRFTEKE